ncbi:SAM-dependent methyltransferase [Nitrincola tibetensis]|uniref:Ribosomal RNA small subunit methyltransferase J n=1 Tax=Nitrincola tibetensis TaxID=2219697 RepID=A0A364NL85_9GAMM|nr:class I SAM-dependent methyltransferase [Nitrincola tibetensis]RAU17804.1 SAM-dependent methyltransferase [Nitrincola tibetensis]
MSCALNLACTWFDAAFEQPAHALALKLNVPAIGYESLDNSDYACLLIVDEAGLQLQVTGKKRPGPVRVDFVSGAVAHRRQFGGGTGQLIAKACGLNKGVRPFIVDATAGLGRDAFVLATLGCSVILLERSALVYELLNDGVEQARGVPEICEIVERMTCKGEDSIDWLNSLNPEDKPDVVYLDPMFPHTEKSAQVKKEMLLFRSLVGQDNDAAALLDAALRAALYRVVVKRPRKAPCVEGVPPTYHLEGKSCRYDIYALKKFD